jgi:hypothetical protein
MKRGGALLAISVVGTMATAISRPGSLPMGVLAGALFNVLSLCAIYMLIYLLRGWLSSRWRSSLLGAFCGIGIMISGGALFFQDALRDTIELSIVVVLGALVGMVYGAALYEG